jgi:hypothetical protein
MMTPEIVASVGFDWDRKSRAGSNRVASMVCVGLRVGR